MARPSTLNGATSFTTYTSLYLLNIGIFSSAVEGQVYDINSELELIIYLKQYPGNK